MSNPSLKSPRVLESIRRVSKSVAKLRQKDKVDVRDVRDATQFYNILVNSYLPSIGLIPKDPAITCIDTCKSILKDNGCEMPFQELIKQACCNNDYTKAYLLGSSSEKIEESKFDSAKNHKVRGIMDALKMDKSIEVINKKPLKLLFKK